MILGDHRNPAPNHLSVQACSPVDNRQVDQADRQDRSLACSLVATVVTAVAGVTAVVTVPRDGGSLMIIH